LTPRPPPGSADSYGGALDQVSAAGRGQDLLLVVNPGDEHALRIANAYQQLRHIPDHNIVFIEPPRPDGFLDMSLDEQQFSETIVRPVARAIQERGLSGQIDFIGALGLPVRFNFDNPGNFGSTHHQSLSYGLTELNQYAAGLAAAEAQFVPTALSARDPREAIHNSQTHVVTYNGGISRETHYYVGGLIAYSGSFGNAVDQVIANLQRTAAADGARPGGTIYFEQNDNIRSSIREGQWPAVQDALRARGIPLVEESDIPGATPQGRSDVRGAVVGAADLTLPNGSTYLPGSWADHLTSYGGAFGPAQTKATEFIAAGAAATSGTVEEPYAIADRFPAASIFLAIDDGLTLGESFYRNVRRPDMIQFIGDLLAQPYADLPHVEFPDSPADEQTVSGSVSLDARATLTSPRFASAIDRLELYVDGLLRDTIRADLGTFRLDTTSLADGRHELRVLAVNNAAAQSEGLAIREFRLGAGLLRVPDTVEEQALRRAIRVLREEVARC